MTRRVVMLAVGFVGSIYISCASANAARERSLCLHDGEQVIARSATAEVLSRKPDHGTVDADAAYLCQYSSKSRVALNVRPRVVHGRSGDVETIDLDTLHVHGLFAAYQVNANSGDDTDGGTLLVLRSFVDGHRRQIIDSEVDRPRVFTSIVLKASGAMAFVDEYGHGLGGGLYVCRPVGCGGASSDPTAAAPELLASRTDGLDVGSLRETADGISWVQNGMTASTPLR